ncbi:hypothetical protein KA005_61870 [bacterium]|nr:hypothetical protein [bacterium]
MKEIFYFIRDKDHKPVISVCLLIETESIQARGVAICSDSETPCSKLNAHQSNGPGIARRRAWKAWKNEKNMYVINREEVVEILDHVRVDNKNIEADIIFINMYGFKAFYFPVLSPKEQRILAAINKTLVVPK